MHIFCIKCIAAQLLLWWYGRFTFHCILRRPSGVWELRSPTEERCAGSTASMARQSRLAENWPAKPTLWGTTYEKPASSNKVTIFSPACKLVQSRNPTIFQWRFVQMDLIFSILSFSLHRALSYVLNFWCNFRFALYVAYVLINTLVIALQVCNIVPGQRYQKKLDDGQVSKMMSIACQHPAGREPSIRKGISSAVFSAWNFFVRWKSLAKFVLNLSLILSFLFLLVCSGEQI